MMRNTPQAVRESLATDRNPILPFEGELLQTELAALGVQQKLLARLLGEAMQQSSETWHDNAPADEVNQHSRVLSGRAERVIADLGSAVLFDYPTPGEKKVTLGSIVGIIYPGESEPEDVLLTGVSRIAPQVLEDAPLAENFSVITLRSPLGAALLGHAAGQDAAYEANNRSLRVTVADVRQFAPEFLTDTAPVVVS